MSTGVETSGTNADTLGGGVLDRSPAAAVLTAGAIGVALTTITIRRSTEYVNADPLLHAIISTERLTPFYWGQDRLANVLPAIAWPIRDIAANYLFQTLVIGCCFFAAIGCFVWCHGHRSGRMPTRATLLISSAVAGLVVLTLLTARTGNSLVLEQQYSFAGMLVVGGLRVMAASSRRVATIAGASLVVAGALVIPTSIVFAPTILLMRSTMGPGRRLVMAAGASALGLAASVSASARWGEPIPQSDTYTTFSPRLFWPGLRDAADSIADSVHPIPTLAVLAACVALLVARRAHLRRSLVVGYIVSAVGAAGWLALFSINEWVVINDHNCRYFFVVYAAGAFVVAGGVTEACARIAEALHARRDLPTAPWGLIATAALAVIALSGLLAARTDLPALVEGEVLARAARDQGADVVVGDYWLVWPTIFAARADGDDDLLAVAERSQPMRDDVVELGADGRTVVVICLARLPEPCVSDLARRTAMAWDVVAVRPSDPPVVEVTLGG